MELFSILFFLATLFGLALCKPVTSAAHNGAVAFEFPAGSTLIAEGVWYSNATSGSTGLTSQLSTSVETCGDSTFENRGSSASPLVSDCKKLRDNIGNTGVWTVDVFTQHGLATWGSCEFGADAHGGIDGAPSFFKVGNDDIRYIIDQSIALYQWNDHGNAKVGTKGFMACDPNGLEIEWGIYHT